MAVFKSHTDIVNLLIDHGADIAWTNNIFHSVLNLAARKGNIEIVKCLMVKGADIYDNHYHCLLALNIVCVEQNIKIIEYVGDNGNGSNEIPLKFTSHHPQLTRIKTFVERYGYHRNILLMIILK